MCIVMIVFYIKSISVNCYETKQKIRNSNKQRRVLKLKLLNESDSSNEI